MSICGFCGRDPDEPSKDHLGLRPVGHACHCVRAYFEGIWCRVAVGVCCARALGPELAAEEDFHDGAPWSVPEDCTCPKEKS